MAEEQELTRLALFGKPVSQSVSPVVHGLFGKQLGVAVDYRAIETDARDFPDALEAFRRAGGLGCNITLPLKRDAWRMAAESSKSAELAQAANTLVHKPPAGWSAHNTDGTGLVTDLVANHGVRIAGSRVLILGAGGAVAGVLGSLLEQSPREVVLVNRSPGRAAGLVRRFRQAGVLSHAGWQDLPGMGEFDLLLNATSLGHRGEVPPLPSGCFAEQAICYDLNYGKAATPLRKYCEDMGKPYIDGLGMLVEQAASSFFIWTGKQPASAEVIAILRAGGPR